MFLRHCRQTVLPHQKRKWLALSRPSQGDLSSHFTWAEKADCLTPCTPPIPHIGRLGGTFRTGCIVVRGGLGYTKVNGTVENDEREL